VTRRQASTRHAEERRNEDDVGEKLEEDHRGGEPADGRKFEKQDQKADQEEIDRGKANNPSIAAFRQHAVCNSHVQIL